MHKKYPYIKHDCGTIQQTDQSIRPCMLHSRAQPWKTSCAESQPLLIDSLADYMHPFGKK